jgi:hypothetical protein
VLRKLGQKGVGDYVSTPRDFYRKENIVFLPGATYPEEEKRIKNPLFAIAINTKLSRKNEDGKKEPTKLSQITHASKTVLFLEQGLPKETTTVGSQSKKDYDGAPKGSAKSFIGRYGGEGVLSFADGSAGFYKAKELLNETGRFPMPQTEVIWTRSPEEDPNKAN